jgi:hypothetical protein
MSNGEDPADERDDEPEEPNGADDEIPISTDEDAERTDPAEDAPEDGVEIDVEVGSPGPNTGRHSDRDGPGGFGIDDLDFGDGGGLGGSGLFDRLDSAVVRVLSRALDGESHLRVYVAVRQRPWSTVEEIADIAGLYPDAVREALETLEARGVVERRGPADDDRTVATEERPDNEDAYEPQYDALAPSAVLSDALGRAGRPGGGFADGLDVDRYLGSEPTTADSDPVRIEIDEDEPDDSGESNEEQDPTGEDDADSDTGPSDSDGAE